MAPYSLADPIPGEIWNRVPDDLRSKLGARGVKTVGQLVEALRSHIELCSELVRSIELEMDRQARASFDEPGGEVYGMGLEPPVDGSPPNSLDSVPRGESEAP